MNDKSSMKILLIEDDIAIAYVLSEALRQYGYVVDVVHDGLMGWEQATREDYRTILLDVNIPKLDGIQFVKVCASVAVQYRF